MSSPRNIILGANYGKEWITFEELGHPVRFRKRPVEIEAQLFTRADVGAVQSLEGVMTVRRGDWIVRGVVGEVYPVRPDIFASTYEPVEPPELAGDERTFSESANVVAAVAAAARIGRLGERSNDREIVIRALKVMADRARMIFAPGALRHAAIEGNDNGGELCEECAADELKESSR